MTYEIALQHPAAWFSISCEHQPLDSRQGTSDVSVIPSASPGPQSPPQTLLYRVRAVAISPPGSKVIRTATIAIEVIVKQPGHARARLARRSRIVSLLNIIDRIAVAAGGAIVALRREHVHEIGEAHVAVGAGRVRAAASNSVIADVLVRAQVRDLLALVVGADSVVAARDEGGAVLLLVGGVLAETLRVVVPGWAVDVGSRRAGVAEPSIAVGVGGPEGDFDAVTGGDVGESGVALDELGAHGVRCDDDFVQVGELVAVLEVGDDFVEDVEGGDVGAGGWVHVVAAVSPVVAVPDEGV
jgi:hypothetical protein